MHIYQIRNFKKPNFDSSNEQIDEDTGKYSHTRL